MKKHDEGYILAYVFVILTVICLIAVSVLTIPLENLKVQKAAVQQMQDRYTAQGKIEQTLTAICVDLKMFSTREGTYTTLDDPDGAQEAVAEQVQQTVALLQSSAEGNSKYIPGITVEANAWSEAGAYAYPIRVTAQSGSMAISCEILLHNVIVPTGSQYKVRMPEIKYTQYVVLEAEGGDQNAA